jgi:hypothetical protein
MHWKHLHLFQGGHKLPDNATGAAERAWRSVYADHVSDHPAFPYLSS